MSSSPEIPAHETRAGRFLVIAVSLGIAAVTLTYAIDAFAGGAPIATTTRATMFTGSRGDGSIYVRYEDNQGVSRLGIVAPDGSGLRDAFPGSPAAQHQQISFSPHGMLMAYVDAREGNRGIYVANADGSDAVKLTDQVNDSWPSWSPDGTKIAFVGTRFDPVLAFCHPGVFADCLTDIYTMNVDGSDITDVTGDPGCEFDPAWSPEGARIAFASTTEVAGFSAISVMNSDGSDRMTLSSSNGGSDFDPRWSPDGSQIVFGGIHNEDWGLFEVGADGTDERTLLFGLGTYAVAPAWSPDGSLIAFGGKVGDYGQPESVLAMQPDGSEITKLADVPEGWAIREIAWRPLMTAPVPGEVLVGPTIDVGPQGQTNAIALGEGGLWVATYDVAGDHIVHLDPSTGDLVASISVDAAPSWEWGGGGLTTGLGRVWVIGAGPSAILSEIDPGSDQVIGAVDLHAQLGMDVAVADGSVWVLLWDHPDQLRLERLDPETLDVIAMIPFDGVGYGHHLFATDAMVFAETNQVHGDTVGDLVLQSVDTATNSVVASLPLKGLPALDQGRLWVAAAEGLQQIDPASGTVCETLDVRGSLLRGPGALWFLQGNDRLARIDTTGTATLELNLPPSVDPLAIATSNSSAWTVNSQGSITRIEWT
jgi:dipeptidyl aminopeptidase/acylaminoacyl peptidase